MEKDKYIMGNRIINKHITVIGMKTKTNNVLFKFNCKKCVKQDDCERQENNHECCAVSSELNEKLFKNIIGIDNKSYETIIYINSEKSNNDMIDIIVELKNISAKYKKKPQVVR